MSDNNSIEEKVFMNPDHSSQVLLQLSELWRDKKLCDAIVEIGPVRIYVHRLLLLAGCPYLLTIGAQHEVPLLEFSLPMSVGVEGLNVFLTYLYDGVLHLTTANLISVERIAEVFRVESILKFCKEFRDSGFHNKVPTYKKYVTVANVVKTKKNTQVKFVEKKAYVKIKEEPVEIEDDELEDDELEVENKRPRIECSSPSDVTKTTVSSCSPLPVVSLPNISETSISSQSFISKALEKFLPSPATIIKSTTDASVPSQPPIKMVASSKLKQIVSGLSERPQKPLYPTVPCPTLINTHSLLDKLPTSVANGSTSSAQNSVDKNTVCTAQALSRTPTPVTCTESSDQGTTMYIKQEPVEEAESTSLLTESQPESASSFGRRANFVRQVACNTQPVPGSTQETLEPIPERAHKEQCCEITSGRVFISTEQEEVQEVTQEQEELQNQNETESVSDADLSEIKSDECSAESLCQEPSTSMMGLFIQNLNMTQNANTKKKTEQDLATFKRYLRQHKETRLPESIPPEQLDRLISYFLKTIKKRDGTEYEASSLRGFISSIDRYLKMKLYPFSILSDLKFWNSRDVLRTRQKQLKTLGKNRNTLTNEELEFMYKNNILGSSTPTSLLNSMWIVCAGNFGLRTGKETHDLSWKDIVLGTDEEGREFLTYPKHSVNPRIYASPSEPEKDPVRLYKLYKEKRPPSMNSPDSPFFLSVNRVVKQDGYWYKKSPLGINKMYNIMRDMKAEAGLIPS